MSYKIAHIFTNFMHSCGGFERTFLLAADQKKSGFQVHFLTGRNVSLDLIKQKENDGFKVIQIGNLRKYIHPLDDFKALCFMFRLLRKEKYDLVNTHYAKAGIIGRFAARLSGVKKIVHTIYGPTFAPTLPFGKRIIYWALEKLTGIFTDQFIFVGEDLRSAYLQAGICTHQNSQVIYDGRDLTHFINEAILSEENRQKKRALMGFDSQTVIIGYVARLVPSKGHIYALKSLEKLKSKNFNIKLLFVGSAGIASEQIFANNLTNTVNNLGLSGDVIFTAWQERPENYYSIFDIFIFPSLYEGLPCVVLEAQASDLPVVGFECSGVRELLGNDSRIVAIKDVSKLTAVLQDEIDCIPLRRRTRGKDIIKLQELQKKFSVDNMIIQTMQVYTKLLN